MLTAEQIEARRSGIGGSDAGAILGLNKYKTPLDVWLEKRGEIEPPDLSDIDAVHFGNVLEDVVANEYMRRTGNKVRRVNQMKRHPDHTFMLANLDRAVVGDKRVLECKTAGAHMSKHWGESGTDQVPDSYLVQINHYMIVTNSPAADLAVLIGGQDFRVYHFELDEDLARMIIARETEFWRMVQESTPPDPYNDHDLETLYAYDSGESIVASDEQIEAVRKLKSLRAESKVIDTLMENVLFTIKSGMGENALLLGDDGNPLATWKRSKDSTRFDAKTFSVDHADLYSKYLKVQPGTRRFLVK